ncbi:hypothetical protein KC351_g78 [Hortaea werneckii]|nr:hypothetical protein KC351_g78 [Hortaea werneckii]
MGGGDGDVYAHPPIKDIANAPANTNANATARLLPCSIFQLSSLRKSSDSNSTNDEKQSKPAESALNIPTTSKPTCESGSQALAGLVEDNGNEQDDKVRPQCYRECHANEYTRRCCLLDRLPRPTLVDRPYSAPLEANAPRS